MTEETNKPYKSFLGFDKHKKFNTYETDFRPEVIASSLIEQGYNPDLIFIERLGIARRGISKEVEELILSYSAADLEDCVRIKVNKEGMYDMLPETLFHTPKQKRLNPDKEEIIDKIKEQASEEFFARKFFHLFEEAADKLLTDAYLFEARYDRKTSYREYSKVFEPFWPVLEKLDQKQAVSFMYVICIFHKIRISYDKIAEAISLILNVQVEISERKLSERKAESYYESRLGEGRLGHNIVLGKHFDDGEYDLRVTVSKLSAHRMREFLPRAKDYNILQELCHLFLPAACFIEYDFKPEASASVFVLSEPGNKNKQSYLGINTYL